MSDAFCLALLIQFQIVAGPKITKICPYNIHSFLFSAVKNENFIRNILIFFLFLPKIIDRGYMLEPPRQGGSNEYPKSMFWKIGIPLHTPVLLYKSGV